MVDYPALNTDRVAGSTLQNGSIWATVIHDITKGDIGTDATPAPISGAKSSLFFGFHDTNSGNNEINTGFYNIEEESIEATDDTGSGFFPAIIPAQ